MELTGEAFFTVAKNPDAPFIVSMRDLSVTALGTSFNIKAYASDSIISAYLMEGRVLVQSPTETIEMLHAGQCINYDFVQQKMQKMNVENERIFTAWHNNELVLENERLDNIVKILERQYNINIVISDEQLNSNRYNGTVENSSLANVLELLSLTSNLHYEFQKNEIILSKK